MLTVYPDFVPFFSVIICTYNRAKLLSRALESLLAQTETDWEAIVVDDGSTDATAEIVRRHVQKNEHIRYLYHTNRGSALSRNVGLLASSGLFATFLDSDDMYKPDHLEHRKILLRENPQVELLHGGVEIVGNPFVPDKKDTTKLIHLSECVIGGTFVIRREAAVKLGGFANLLYAEDAEFYERADSATGLIIANTDDPTYIYNRISSDSQTFQI